MMAVFSHLKEALIDKDGARSLDEWCSLSDAGGRSECIKQPAGRGGKARRSTEACDADRKGADGERVSE